MSVNQIKDSLMELAREQQAIFRNLMVKLFGAAVLTLKKTHDEIADLKERHAIYHSNVYQLHQLKGKVTTIQKDHDAMIAEILKEIVEQKQKAKQILLNVLEQLEKTIDTQILHDHLNELMHNIDQMFDDTADFVRSSNIFLLIGFAIQALIVAIVAITTGSTVFSIATLGIGSILVVSASELRFRSKLTELIKTLTHDIGQLEDQRDHKLRQLDKYFDGFIIKLSKFGCNTSIIVWYDQNINNMENRSFSKRLRLEFPSYQLTQFKEETDLIAFIQSNIDDNIILITSGSSGESVITEIGHYWNIKGIIVYTSYMNVGRHQQWGRKFKKMLLVTANGNEVVEKIKRIELGDVYFLVDGFSLEDIRLKLPNIDNYLSTKEDAFMIHDFASINLDINHHIHKMKRLYEMIISKNLYPNGVPNHLKYENLRACLNEFIKALREADPHKKLITLYTKEAPFYYKIINDILNRLDEEMISLICDFIKALRYALLIYNDMITMNPTMNPTEIIVYRGISLKRENSFDEFQKKFTINDIIIFPAFLSASFNKEKAKFFTRGKGVILKITANCAHINQPKCISAESEFKCEDEVLINCFSVLKVEHIEKVTDQLLIYNCLLEQM